MSKRCTLCQKELTSGQIICLECATELKAKPTLDECIKEWEEKGWKVDEDGYFKIINFIKGDRGICFDIKEKNYFTFQPSLETTSFYIDAELHNLIHKTLKALEVENNKTPMKVIRRTEGDYDANWFYTAWYCPNCEKCLGQEEVTCVENCPKCGQHLDWSDNDE